MRSLEESKEKIESRGVRIVAVSVDPPETTRNNAQKQGYTFRFLSDEKAEVIRRWDLLHPGGFRGADIARPAEFLLDPSGTIRWVNLTESYKVRLKGQEILGLLDQFGLAAPGSAQQDLSSIKNFLRVNESFCTAGQPTMEELARLKAEGIKAVINLRRPTEYNAEEEAAKARELGLRYLNIPVDPNEPKDEQVTEFLKVTDDPANRPAFIHCSMASRVAGFWMARRVLRDAWKLEDAEKEAEKVGLRNPKTREFALDYIRRNQEK